MFITYVYVGPAHELFDLDFLALLLNAYRLLGRIVP
jgi:hypothetical protein